MTAGTSRNRTLTCAEKEYHDLAKSILRIEGCVSLRQITGQLIAGDLFDVAIHLPQQFVDLLILDPPYNLTKDYHGNRFQAIDKPGYALWFGKVVDSLIPMLKPCSTIYVCSDWKTSSLVLPVLEDRFHVRNRITWEREKGRGARRNWKNNTEDIWFCTNSRDYYFDVEVVKLKRKVLAPYRLEGKPKDWTAEENGNYRLTHPSNIWTDLTIPFWSMPENTPHPTQKPEKLLAKLILASSREKDFVFDPFIGSGTTAVVAEKLGRQWSGIDINLEYLCWAKKRICNTGSDPAIQGYSDGVFWERNSLPRQRRTSSAGRQPETIQESLLK